MGKKEIAVTLKLLQIDYLFSGPWGAEMAEEYSDLAHRIAAIPGLICKVWTENREAGEAGGVYLFEDEASLDAYLGGRSRGWRPRASRVSGRRNMT